VFVGTARNLRRRAARFTVEASNAPERTRPGYTTIVYPERSG